jgi:hypothetical protein
MWKFLQHVYVSVLLSSKFSVLFHSLRAGYSLPSSARLVMSGVLSPVPHLHGVMLASAQGQLYSYPMGTRGSSLGGKAAGA